MSTGKAIFRRNAKRVLRDISLDHLDPSYGAAIDTVRWCLVVRGRPTHHRLVFLESACPGLLAYLERLASVNDTAAWRSAEERILIHAEVLRVRGHHICSRPWFAAIFYALPEFATIGQELLDRQRPNSDFSPEAMPKVGSSDDGGEGEQGSTGKTGGAGQTTSLGPIPVPTLVFPVVSVQLTETERKLFDLEDETAADTATTFGADGPDVAGGYQTPKGPGGRT
jgi:hypothetical protein